MVRQFTNFFYKSSPVVMLEQPTCSSLKSFDVVKKEIRTHILL